MDNARRRGWEVVGLEFIPSIFETDGSRNVEMIHSPMWDLGVLDGRRFDAIATQSLEHMPDVLGYLAGLRRLLKAEGIVLIEAPNQFEGLKERIKDALLAVLGDRLLPYLYAEAAPQFHLSFFTPRSLRRALEESGFEILESRSYLPWNPIYHHTQRLRTLREASFLIGGLVERGPSVEVIARPTA
jgi:SAM-dependent methyltransferase